jgi:hypothetical protein
MGYDIIVRFALQQLTFICANRYEGQWDVQNDNGLLIFHVVLIDLMICLDGTNF